MGRENYLLCVSHPLQYEAIQGRKIFSASRVKCLSLQTDFDQTCTACGAWSESVMLDVSVTPETHLFVYLAQWLKQSQDDNDRMCSSSLLVNFKYSYTFITLEIAECTYDTCGCHVSLHLYSTKIHGELAQTVLGSVKHLLSTYFLSWCGVSVFPHCLNPERWVHGSQLTWKISPLIRPSSCQAVTLYISFSQWIYDTRNCRLT
jgi:hypothetical protein